MAEEQVCLWFARGSLGARALGAEIARVLQDAGQEISPPGSAAAEIQLPSRASGAGRT
jgi:hypothetical protein